jgi:hypothetical protein
MRSDRTTDLTRLRLAAALVHQLPAASLTIWPVDGPSVVVSRSTREHPDLSACTLRAMVRTASDGVATPAALRWLFDIADLSVDGVGVRHVGDGVVAVDHSEHLGRWWPTTLDAEALTPVVAAAAAGALESRIVGSEVVAASEVAAHVDRELGVTVVQLRTPPGPIDHDRRCDELARALSQACVISELLLGAGVGSRS